MIKSRTCQYEAEGKTFKGYIAYPDSNVPTPAVIVAPTWAGCNAFAKKQSERMAAWGYVGFAVDVYGDGEVGETKEHCEALCYPLIADRKSLYNRLKSAYTALCQDKRVASHLISAIGFCFGGLCALDMARSGLPLISAVSFHGLLIGTVHQNKADIAPSLLILHGFEDPLVPPEQLLQFQQEMTARNADWQLHTFAHTAHAFTNPEAQDKEAGNYYQKTSAKRAYQLARQFLAQQFIGTIK